jgi:hypothetical protein
VLEIERDVNAVDEPQQQIEFERLAAHETSTGRS